MRDITERKQRAFAEEVGIPLMVLKNIEARRTRLNEETGRKIAVATGVALGWLLDNDLEAPVLAADGQPYTKRHFEIAQAIKQLPMGLGYPAAWDSKAYFLAFCGMLGAFFEASPFHGAQAELLFWKTRRFLEGLTGEHPRIPIGYAYREPDADEPVAGGLTKGQIETGIRVVEKIVREYRDPDKQVALAKVRLDAEQLSSAPDLPEQLEAYKNDPKFILSPQSSRPRRRKSE